MRGDIGQFDAVQVDQNTFKCQQTSYPCSNPVQTIVDAHILLRLDELARRGGGIGPNIGVGQSFDSDC